jgi:hypothetical protein
MELIGKKLLFTSYTIEASSESRRSLSVMKTCIWEIAYQIWERHRVGFICLA